MIVSNVQVHDATLEPRFINAREFIKIVTEQNLRLAVKETGFSDLIRTNVHQRDFQLKRK